MPDIKHPLRPSLLKGRTSLVVKKQERFFCPPPPRPLDPDDAYLLADEVGVAFESACFQLQNDKEVSSTQNLEYIESAPHSQRS